MSGQKSAPAVPNFSISTSGSGMADLLRDFLVDGLGILLPGFGFLFSCIPALIAPLAWFVIVANSIFGGRRVDYTDLVLKSVSEPTPGNFHLEIFLALAGMAFIVGHLLFRQDIAKPDRFSFIKSLLPRLSTRCKIWRWILRLFGKDMRFEIDWRQEAPSPKEAARRYIRSRRRVVRVLICRHPDRIYRVQNAPSAIRVDGMARAVYPSHKALSDVPVEYPYHHLHEYLIDKGFDHLCGMVSWRGKGGRDITKRTKHFINLLKMNIAKASPSSYNIIAKNEAHIRLGSSVWYAAYYISYASLMGLSCGVAGSVLAMVTKYHVVHVEFVVLPLLMLGLSIVVQSAIERSLHYQRCREIVFVLHVASLLFIKDRDVVHGIQDPPKRTLADFLPFRIIRNRP